LEKKMTKSIGYLGEIYGITRLRVIAARAAEQRLIPTPRRRIAPIVKIALIVAALAAIAVPAFAQAPQPKVTDTGKLTVRQVIAIMNGLKLLDNAPVTNKDGNQVMTPTGFEFSGDTLLTIAIDLNHATEIFTNYQIASNAVVKQLAKGGATVPEDKRGEYLEQDTMMGNKESGVLLSRIHVDDLCLEVKLPKCPKKNAIPGSTLSLLVPILDGVKQ
jgi:hypothetical protein